MFNLFFWVFFCSRLFASQEIDLQNYEQVKNKIVPLLIINVNLNDSNSEKILEILKKDLMMSGQFEVQIQSEQMPSKINDVTKYFDEGYSVVNFLIKTEDGKFIESRLYDAARGLMVNGFKTEVSANLKKFAHHLAGKIWSQLTGEKSSFESKIAYVKRIPKTRSKYRTTICYKEINDEQEYKIVETPTINVKPQWNDDKSNPGIWYSEFTSSNVRLMFSDLNANKKVVFNFDGTIVGISCKDDGQAIYCRSGNIWHFKYDPVEKKGVHKKVIEMEGKSSCPNFTANGNIIFGCDFEDKSSRICLYDCQTTQMKSLTNSGYCVAPAYCKENNKIVYCKKVQGVMQLIIHDLTNNHTEQVTSDSWDKIDPSWSPCGHYIALCIQTGNISSIGILNLKTKKINLITCPSDNCSYPAWSNHCDY